MAIEGAPSVQEHAILHRESRTLLVCDLLFNLGPPADLWTRLAMGWINDAYGPPAVSRLYRLAIKDRAAFRHSIEAMLQSWHFDRIVPGHGAVIESEGKTKLLAAL